MILVTGAKGIIGRAVVARLRSDGKSVEDISRDKFDLTSGKKLASFVKGRPSGIIHLAAAVPHLPHYPDTEALADLTRRIDQCIYHAGVAWQCPVVYASGCSLYDRRSPHQLTEDDPISTNIVSPYLRAKVEGEVLFQKLTDVVIARIAGLIGKDLPRAVVASQFVAAAASDGTIQLWGSGKREQDFVDIDDIAVALIKALQLSGRNIVNIASGKPVTMLEFAELIIATLDRGRYVFNNRPDPREGEFARFDNRLARELLGWSPEIGLSESIQSMAVNQW